MGVAYYWGVDKQKSLVEVDTLFLLVLLTVVVTLGEAERGTLA